MSMHNVTFGSWVVEPELYCDGKLPQEIATGIAEATKDIVGAAYKPLMGCGHQLVNGINYMLICEITLVTNPPVKHVAQVILNKSSGGKFSILSPDIII